ncbi:MAG: hypothetical protein KKF68_02320 [Nanoarchaeota archaeon]|nr:hypothetical protein [Nanoarchaeota archaeon]
MTKSLEEIGTALLEERISVEEAKKLTAGMKISSFNRRKKAIVSLLEGRIQLVNLSGKILSYINYDFLTDERGVPFVMIQRVESSVDGNSYLRTLYSKFENTMKKKDVDYILLEVDEMNDRAISLYESLGFVVSGQSFEEERIFMRKDLD